MEVERGTADRAALRALEDALAAGEPVAVFPEGTRKSGPEIGELYAGAAYLAIKLGVPIVPVGIGGSEHILPKGKLFPRIHRVAVSVGHPIHPPVLDGRARRAAANQADRGAAASSCRRASTTPSGWRGSRRASAREDARRVDPSVLGERAARAVGHRTAEQDRDGDVEGRHQLAELPRRREVLVLVGDVHLLDAVASERGGR